MSRTRFNWTSPIKEQKWFFSKRSVSNKNFISVLEVTRENKKGFLYSYSNAVQLSLKWSFVYKPLVSLVMKTKGLRLCFACEFKCKRILSTRTMCMHTLVFDRNRGKIKNRKSQYCSVLQLIHLLGSSFSCPPRLRSELDFSTIHQLSRSWCTIKCVLN